MDFRVEEHLPASEPSVGPFYAAYENCPAGGNLRYFLVAVDWARFLAEVTANCFPVHNPKR